MEKFLLNYSDKYEAYLSLGDTYEIRFLEKINEHEKRLVKKLFLESKVNKILFFKCSTLIIDDRHVIFLNSALEESERISTNFDINFITIKKDIISIYGKENEHSDLAVELLDELKNPVFSYKYNSGISIDVFDNEIIRVSKDSLEISYLYMKHPFILEDNYVKGNKAILFDNEEFSVSKLLVLDIFDVFIDWKIMSDEKIYKAGFLKENELILLTSNKKIYLHKRNGETINLIDKFKIKEEIKNFFIVDEKLLVTFAKHTRLINFKKDEISENIENIGEVSQVLKSKGSIYLKDANTSLSLKLDLEE